MMESQRTSSPQHYGEDYHKETFHPLMDYLEDSLDTGQTLKMDYINSSLFKTTEIHILLLTLNTLEVQQVLIHFSHTLDIMKT